MMTLGFWRLTRNDPHAWRIAAAGLLAAAVLVGVAIYVGGSAARALNPIGAVLWVASGVLLALTLPEARRPAWGWAAALAGGFVLGAIVRPGGLLEAIIAFAIAGALVVVVAGDRNGGWALLVPAVYLPVHLVIGIGRAMLRNGGVRTEPPPTAAIVPLAMILAALLAGIAAASFVRRGY
jgi:hypothetical protein